MKFAIVGSGSIGVAWAIVFARTGYDVNIYDIDEERIAKAKIDLDKRLEMLGQFGLSHDEKERVLSRISYFVELSEALKDVDYVQECVPERRELKEEVFGQLDALTGKNVILASSSSAITASEFAGDIRGKERCLVVHPGNPPYLLSVAEVVPAPFTSAETIEMAMDTLTKVNMRPVLVHHEIEGFVFNRLQGAILREAYCLVRDGVVSAADVDRIVTGGLAKRWAVVGPFATTALNVQGGVRAHAARMGASYESMGRLRGQNDPWTPELVKRVDEEISKILSVEDWDKNVLKRDRALLELTQLIEGNPSFDFGF